MKKVMVCALVAGMLSLVGCTDKNSVDSGPKATTDKKDSAPAKDAGKKADEGKKQEEPKKDEGKKEEKK